MTLLLSQGYSLASQLGHSIVDPVPSLFTFKIEDSQLADLSGVIIFIIIKILAYNISNVNNHCLMPAGL
jgi:predicted flavoprotein YhiN